MAVALMLHRGAAGRASAADVPDPRGLPRRLAPDRALVTFTDLADATGKTPALQDLLRAWSGAE